MDIAARLTIWKNAVLGVSLDIDHAFGAQCADPVLSWGQTVFPSVHWSVLFPPVNSVKDIFETANQQYFERIVNDHNNVNQLPEPGDICVFAAAPEAGYTSTFKNDDGHIGVVDHADQNYVYLIQQDSSTSQVITQLRQRPWRYTRCKGWLRPRVSGSSTPLPTPSPEAQSDSRIGKTLYLHPVDQWSVYRVGQQPIRTQRIGYLVPIRYTHGPDGRPGLTYKIIGVSQYPNTVTIVTDTYGPVDIYVDADGEII